MNHLFTPLKIRGIELKNRVAVSPMCQYSSHDGFANDWHFVHLGSRAVGGAGLVIAEATAVSPEGRISPADLGIWKNEHVEELQRITGFIRQQGAVAGIQLAHAGRKASHQEPWIGGKQINLDEGGWEAFAPSSISFIEPETAPTALTIAGIHQVINDFTSAAERALLAGFQVIEIHGAHGYLINEFLSPLTNKRQDLYGGSFENRIRLLLEIISAI
ncbi:MAG: oxidoreductase, partial [Chitinophagaceae bacterium]